MLFGSQPMAVSLGRRGVQDELATLKSWDACMAKAWCKYPVIAGCVVGGLVLISMAWCCYRCCCRRRRKAARSKSTFFNDPVPAYMGGPSNSGYSGQPSAPQYAYFESGTTGGKGGDDLPVMPSWNNAKSEKVEDVNVKVEDIELGEVDHDNGRQKTPPQTQTQSQPQRPQPALSASPPRLPLGNDRHRNNNNFSPSNNLNPFGPQRLNSPFGKPNNGRVVPPNRTQSPYPESNNMPTVPQVQYNAPVLAPIPSRLDEFDFSPHINAQNQGPYANADVFPPEPTYQKNVSPQFTGTTSTPAPYQQASYTGTTVAETYSPPQQQRQQPPLPQSNSGYVAQMDDDFGHSPVHLTHPQLSNSVPHDNHNGGFNHNDFDHGGYSSYNNNNQAPAGGYQDPFQRAQNNTRYERQPQQAWGPF